MTNKCEYFANGLWHGCTYKRLVELSNDNATLINRRTAFTFDGGKAIYYREGLDLYHRWDGPAIQYYVGGGTKLYDEDWEDWFLHGIRIHAFEQYYINTEALTENLFRYVQDYPYFLKQTILLAEHNKWLNEEQILFLKSILFLQT